MSGPDGRRLEAVAGGFPVHCGAQVAVDITFVSPVQADGRPRNKFQDVWKHDAVTDSETTHPSGRPTKRWTRFTCG